MQIVYAHQPFPERFARALFLAGPSPRKPSHPDWRPAALAALRARGYADVVFVPMPESGHAMPSYDAQVEWEAAAIALSDCVLFWIPRDLETMPGFTTNVEWGRLESSGRVVLGFPPDAPKMRYLAHWAERWAAPIHHTLEATIGAALDHLGPGAERAGGERGVPLDVWRTDAFQGWYAAQRAAGNRLDGAEIHWVHRVGPDKKWLVFWALKVDVHVAAEGRNKSNELLIGRPDVSAVVLYERGAASVEATRVALVREFRACGRTRDGFVHELPGGSSFEPGEAAAAVAAEEVFEELGLRVDPTRLRLIASRQIGATLSPYVATVYAVALDEADLDAIAADTRPHGHTESSELTWAEVRTVGECLTTADLDWATLGMILQAVR